MTYWNQFDTQEIKDILGIENDVSFSHEEDEIDLDQDDDHDDDHCARCTNGCNYCLMVG